MANTNFEALMPPDDYVRLYPDILPSTWEEYRQVVPTMPIVPFGLHSDSRGFSIPKDDLLITPDTPRVGLLLSKREGTIYQYFLAIDPNSLGLQEGRGDAADYPRRYGEVAFPLPLAGVSLDLQTDTRWLMERFRPATFHDPSGNEFKVGEKCARDFTLHCVRAVKSGLIKWQRANGREIVEVNRAEYARIVSARR